MNELEQNKGNASAMTRTIDDMLEFAKGNDRAELLDLKSKIKQNQSNQRSEAVGGWIIWLIVIVLFGFVSSLF